MICAQQESITIGQNLCPSLRGNIASTPSGQITSLEIRNELWATGGNSDAIYTFSTNTNTLLNTAHLGGGVATGVCYVPPQKGLSITTLKNPFTIPAVGNNASISVFDTSQFIPTKYIFVDGPATFKVISVQGPSSATVQFANFNGDLTPGSILNAGANVYATAARTDFIYVTGNSNLYSVDPDTFAVSAVTGIANVNPRAYFASVSNRVCFGASGKLYSYNIANGSLTTNDISATNPAAGTMGYSSAQDVVYVGQGSNSDPTNLAVVAPYASSSMAYSGPDMKTPQGPNNQGVNVNFFDVAYCPTNNSVYVGVYFAAIVLPPQSGFGQVTVFNATSGAVIAQLALQQDTHGYNYGPGSVVFNLATGIIVVGDAGGIVLGSYPGLLYVYSTSNALVCTVAPTDNTRRNRSAAYNASTGRVYVISDDNTGGGIDYYA